MTLIENSPLINADITNISLLHLLIKDSSVVSSLIGESSKSTGCRFKGKRNRATIDKIKHLSTDYDSPNQQLLTIKDVLKDPVFSKESDQSDMINIDIKLPSIVDLLKKL